MLNKTKLLLLLCLFSFLILGSFTISYLSLRKVFAFSFFGNVLGDDDENDGEDQEDEEDDEDNENDEDEEDEDDNENDENERDEEEDEDEEEEKETRTTTVNRDGTRTVTKKKIEDNGKVEIETKTYNASGKVIEEYKSKEEDGVKEAEYEAKIFSEDGGKISEMKYKSKTGEEFKLMIKNEDQSITKVVYDENHDYIRVIGRIDDDDSETEEELDDDSSSEVLIMVNEDGEYEVERQGRKAEVSLPITVDDSNGAILLLTDSGEKELRYLPDSILQKVEESDDSIEVVDAEIKEKEGKVIYELNAEKAEKIIGLFDTRINSLITYDAETGQEIESVQSFWESVVDLISF